jgi:benzoate membrane transport protein
MTNQVSERASLRDFNSAAFWAGVSTFIFMVFGALTVQISIIQEFDISNTQARSWIVITWLTAGVVSLPFIVYYRQPLGIGWTLPGLVYMASLADRFSFEQLVAANLVAGLVIVLLGLIGFGSRVIHLVPLPILMGMFAASIMGFITRAVEATAEDFAIAAPMIAAYVVGRLLNNPRVPSVGLAVVTGAVMIVVLGRLGTATVEAGAPALAYPGLEFNLEAIVTIAVPMVILVLGVGNVQGMGYLIAQGYRVPSNQLTTAVGAMSVVNALFGGHPAAMTRVSSAMLGGPDAGPFEKRYWGAIVAFILVIGVAGASGVLVAAVEIVPPAYVYVVAGIAILASFEDALIRAFSGSLRLGAVVAFGVTASTVAVAGIPSAFWALIAGIGASLLLERRELIRAWRRALDDYPPHVDHLEESAGIHWPEEVHYERVESEVEA